MEIKCNVCDVVRKNKKEWVTAIGKVNDTKYNVHLCPEHSSELPSILVKLTMRR